MPGVDDEYEVGTSSTSVSIAVSKSDIYMARVTYLVICETWVNTNGVGFCAACGCVGPA